MPINENNLGFECKDGSISDGVRVPTLHSFGLNKPSGFKLLTGLKKSIWKKNESVVNSMKFHIEDQHKNF